MFYLKDEYQEALQLSLSLSFVTTLILLLISLPLAYWLSYKRNIFKIIIEIIVMLPLVLPPSVIGFYLLLFLNQKSIIGKTWHFISGQNLVFNFSGLIIGSVVYSLPFIIKPIQNSFMAIPTQLIDAASTLGAKPLDRFFSILIPLAKNGILSGIILSFTHTLGEFGVVLMLGGNIPGKTKTISIAIFDSVEQLEYTDANIMSLLLVLLSVISLGIIYYLNENKKLSYHERTLSKYRS